MITEFVGFSFIRSDQRDDLTAIMAAPQGHGDQALAVSCTV